MSRRKRSRKIRSMHRRERRAARFADRLTEAETRLYELIEQERVRRAIESSELPDGVKRVFGLFVSPVGQTNEEIRRFIEKEKR